MVINIYGARIMNLIYCMSQWRPEVIPKTATVPYIKQAIANKKINLRTGAYSDHQLKEEVIKYLVTVDFIAILESCEPIKIKGVWNLELKN